MTKGKLTNIKFYLIDLRTLDMILRLNFFYHLSHPFINGVSIKRRDKGT